MKERVAMVVERAIPRLGSAERSIFELAWALSDLGLKTDILAATGQAETKTIHLLCGNGRATRVRLRAFGKALQAHLAANTYSIIHSVLPFGFADVYQPFGGTYAEKAVQQAASYERQPWRTVKKATSWASARRRVLSAAERRLCQGAKGPTIAAASGYVVEQLKRHYGTTPARIRLIRNGVRIRPCSGHDAPQRLRRQILAELGLQQADQPVLLLFAAHDFRLKGLGPLIRAMQIADGLHGSESKCCLVVAGAGPRRRYEALAAALGLANRILFLGHLRRIRDALSVTDVAVLPTFYDPASRFILEALGAGTPVITTRFNGAIDLFENGRHGIVIDSARDTHALAEAIAHFCDAGNVHRARAAIAQDNMKDRVSVLRAARELLGLYEEVLRSKNR